MFIFGYLIALLISILFILIFRTSLNNKVWIVACIFTCFAILVIPRSGSNVDALKYFSVMDLIRHSGHPNLVQAWSLINQNSNTIVSSNVPGNTTLSFSATPIMGILVMIMSFFPNSFLLGLTTFCTFFFVLKMIQIATEKNHLSTQEFCFGFLIFASLFVFSAAIGGIRNDVVGTIFGWLCFRIAENKSKVTARDWFVMVILAIVLSLIHPFTLILFVLFTLTLLSYHTHWIRIIDGLMVLQTLYQGAVIQLLSLFGGIPFFGSIVYKSSQYLGNNATIHISSTANLIRDICRLIFLLILFVIVEQAKQHQINVRYREFIIMLFCLLIGSARDQLLFDRILLVLLPLMSPYFVVLPNTFMYQVKKNKGILTYIYIIVLSGYALFSLIDNLRAGFLYYHFAF